MDFARKILGKYGWKDGDGLGKNNDGIAKPLRATLKFDNAGFGADQAASDFNNHWWERVFNDAASNVEVKQDGETIKMELVDNDEGVEITTKGYSIKKLKKAKENRLTTKAEKSENTYNNFLQAATLTNTGDEVANPERIDVSDIEVTKVKVLTDEELFKACGGRTAHKGARHGLKLSGKLARLQQQEEELLAKMQATKSCSSNDEGDSKKKVKKKKELSNDTTNFEEKNKNEEKEQSKKKRTHESDEIYHIKDMETKKKKQRSSVERVEDEEPLVCDEEIKSKKNKRKNKKADQETNESTGLDEKTKKRKRNQKSSNPDQHLLQKNFEDKIHKKSKKKSKNKEK